MISNLFDRVLKRIGSKDQGFNSILKKTSAAFSIKLGNAFLGFLYNILLAKMIGAEGAGIYYLAFSFVSIPKLISELGFRNVLLRFVSSNAGDKNWVAVKGLIRQTYLFSCLMACLFVVVIFFNATFIAEKFFDDVSTGIMTVKIMSLGLLPMTLILHSAAILKALEKYKEGLIIGGLMVPLLGIPLMLILTNLYGVIGAVYSLVTVNLITLVVGLYWIWKFLPNLSNYTGSFNTKLIFATGIPLFLIAITNFIMAGGDVMFLGYWEDDSNVGVYGLAKRIAALTAFILVAINSIVAPKFSKLYAQGKIEELKSVAQNSMKLLALFAFPAVGFLTIFAPQIMSLIGKDFEGGYIVLIILALGQFVNVLTGSVGFLLMMTGFEKEMTANIVIVSFVTAGLYFFLIPTYGIIGAAIASAFGLAVQNIVAFILVKVKLGFWVVPKLKLSN